MCRAARAAAAAAVPVAAPAQLARWGHTRPRPTWLVAWQRRQQWAAPRLLRQGRVAQAPARPRPRACSRPTMRPLTGASSTAAMRGCCGACLPLLLVPLAVQPCPPPRHQHGRSPQAAPERCPTASPLTLPPALQRCRHQRVWRLLGPCRGRVSAAGGDCEPGHSWRQPGVRQPGPRSTAVVCQVAGVLGRARRSMRLLEQHEALQSAKCILTPVLLHVLSTRASACLVPHPYPCRCARCPSRPSAPGPAAARPSALPAAPAPWGRVGRQPCGPSLSQSSASCGPLERARLAKSISPSGACAGRRALATRRVWWSCGMRGRRQQRSARCALACSCTSARPAHTPRPACLLPCVARQARHPCGRQAAHRRHAGGAGRRQRRRPADELPAPGAHGERGGADAGAAPPQLLLHPGRLRVAALPGHRRALVQRWDACARRGAAWCCIRVRTSCLRALTPCGPGPPIHQPSAIAQSTASAAASPRSCVPGA